MTSSSNTRTEYIYILYGSQTGNSEQFAHDFAAQVPSKLNPQAIKHYADITDDDDSSNSHNNVDIIVKPKVMQCDDFLEIERCAWTRAVVIITSSYGVGQAPLGCRRYRDLCDAWQLQYKQFPFSLKVLTGVHYVMCGLGDSKYTNTFFHNPTVIDTAMQMAGAQRHGPLGKADASGSQDQAVVFEQWMDQVWKHLANVVAASQDMNPQQLIKAKQETISLCRIINPEFMPQKKGVVTVADVLKLLAAVIALSLLLEYYRSTRAD